jgi:4-hydroxy-tetrahydrodipicolinate synthase
LARRARTFASLARDQRRRVVETVVDHSANLPVLAGCGGTAVQSTRQYVADAANAGADAAVVVTPYYHNAAQEGLTRYYEPSPGLAASYLSL